MQGCEAADLDDDNLRGVCRGLATEAIRGNRATVARGSQKAQAMFSERRGCGGHE